MQIYIHRNSQQLGPYTEVEIKTQLASGAISLQDHVWWQGQANWLPLGQSPLLAPGFTPPPETAKGPSSMGAPQATSKLAVAAVVCAAIGIPLVLPEIAAIILGHLSLATIKKNPKLKGYGMALSAVIGGYLWLLIVIGSVTFSFLSMPSNDVPVSFKSLDAQLKAAEVVNGANHPANKSGPTTNAPIQSTPTPTMTNSADQSANSAPAPTNSPDQSTNSSPAATNNSMPSTNAPSTNSPAASTNSPAASTNAAPMNQ